MIIDVMECQVDELWRNTEGQYHREVGLEWPDGTKKWILHGELHMKDGSSIEWNDGTQFWFLNGELHREDGPAAEHADGTKYWYLNGQCHRKNGPAVEYINGDKEWYIEGRKFTEAEFNNLQEQS